MASAVAGAAKQQGPRVSTAAAVLLTKQDFEQLRNHALSPSKDLPRCIPISAPVMSAQISGGGAPGRGKSLSASDGKQRNKASISEKGAAPRRARSASGRRPPQLPPRPHSDPIDLEAAAMNSLVAVCRGAPPAPTPNAPGAARPLQALKAQNIASRVRSDRIAADSSSIDKVRCQTPPRQTSRQPSRQPPAPTSRSNSRGLSVTTVSSVPLGNSGGAGGPVVTPGASSAAVPGPVGPSSASAASSRGSGGSADLGVLGVGPRRLPRPADQVLAQFSMQSGQAVPMVRVGLEQQGKLSMLAANSLGLQVSGQAATVCVHPANSETPTTDGGVSDLKVEEWTSSDEEGDDAAGTAGEDSDTAPFYYREYRYQRNQANQEPQQRGRSIAESRRRRARRVDQPRDESSDSGYSSPWGLDEDSPRWHGLESALCGTSRSSTPCCEEEAPDDDLFRVAEVLVKFYGLPGGVERAVRFKYNAVCVNDDAWAKRQRESNLETAPILWVRGDRVYDFHGDRGTISEFEHDLLGRQVEDDNICRQRRREQGLMPFPFVAVPMKREEDPDEREDDNSAGTSAAAKALRKHWL